MEAVGWWLLAFGAGALPFSVWLGRWALHKDIRAFGDHNPGAANVFRAGGRAWAVLAVILDFLKGAVPVGLANYVGGMMGWGLVAVALAPVLGHAYSPFLRLRGGKALAVTFGIWCGLTVWLGPTVLGIALGAWLAILAVPGWAVLAGMLTLGAVLLIAEPAWVLLAVWVGNTAILLWKHRANLAQPPQPGKSLVKSLLDARAAPKGNRGP
ncbi:MAG: glycerol-3-phosphate acyltransferase [Caldilineaceae bacterium]|nr:glycerol-3-phosphate acyltransferase [Caldilineaceae bacterium]